MARVFLSDLIDITKFKKGQANIVVAPCHSGKTTAAIRKIAGIATCRERVLFLIDTTAGKDSLLKRAETERYSFQWLKEIEEEWWGSLKSGDGIRVMTYHQLGYQLQEHPDFMKDIEVVICDEMHNLIKYVNIERANNKKAQVAGKATEQKVCQLAFEELSRVANDKSATTLVVIMTATVNALSIALDKSNVATEFFSFTDRVTTDKTLKTIHYSDIEKVLEQLPLEERAIVFVPTITMMRKLAASLDDGWRSVCCLWGLHNEDHEMSETQLAVRKAILSTQRIPEDIDVLFINAAYETSLNILNEDFNTMVIHSGSPDVRIQVRGRLRHDINTLYVYDASQKHIIDYFPEEYYGCFLTTKETTEIVNKMNLTDSKGNKLHWPSIKAELQNEGVLVENRKVKGVRGCFVKRPE